MTVPKEKAVVNKMDRLAVFVSRHEIIRTQYVWNTVYEYPRFPTAHALSSCGPRQRNRAWAYR